MWRQVLSHVVLRMSYCLCLNCSVDVDSKVALEVVFVWQDAELDIILYISCLFGSSRLPTPVAYRVRRAADTRKTSKVHTGEHAQPAGSYDWGSSVRTFTQPTNKSTTRRARQHPLCIDGVAGSSRVLVGVGLNSRAQTICAHLLFVEHWTQQQPASCSYGHHHLAILALTSEAISETIGIHYSCAWGPGLAANCCIYGRVL